MGVLFWQMIRASSSIAPIWKRIRFPFIREPAPFFYRSFRYPLRDHLRVERDFAGRLARGETCGKLVVAGSVLHRIRVEVNDGSKVDEDGCKKAGALGVVKPSDNTVQVVIGVQVQAVFDELEKLL